MTTLGHLGESGFIDSLKRLAPNVRSDDDAAFLTINQSPHALSIDALVDGNHFRRDWSSAADIGWKAISVNVSDLCASGGGSPSWLLVAIGAPKDTAVEFLERLYEGMREACARYSAFLVGGDTVAAEQLFITVSALGPVLKPVRRSGAKVGDVLAVTGPLGRAACGVNLLLSQDPKKVSPEDAMACMDAHRRPVARVEEAKHFATAVHAAIDISDGLASDVRHLADASGVGVSIDTLPIAPEVQRIAAARGWDAEAIALAGGEDFELLFALPEEHLGDLLPIGRVVEGRGVTYRGTELEMTGFDHFKR